MINLDPFDQHNRLRQMQDRHEQMVEGIRHRQKFYGTGFAIILLLIIAGLSLFDYIGYKLLAHFGIF